MDVVAPGTLSNWTNNPFSATLTNGKLFGRGASDMKSGLAAEIIAMLEILESQPQLNGQIRLLATVGEETGEYGAAQLTELGYADHLTGIIIAEPTNNMTNLIYTLVA
jgi:Acetylornithine deacetylase/Succinyl-diaminopimelate desuccinylase and related deacylases